MAAFYAVGGAIGMGALAFLKLHGANLPTESWAWSAGAFVVATPLAIAAFRYRRRMRRASASECQACGYDLRASPDQCPECGATAPKSAAEFPS